MVEHNDWDHQKLLREQLDEDNSPRADNVNHVQEESVQESYDHDQHDDDKHHDQNDYTHDQHHQHDHDEHHGLLQL